MTSETRKNCGCSADGHQREERRGHTHEDCETGGAREAHGRNGVLESNTSKMDDELTGAHEQIRSQAVSAAKEGSGKRLATESGSGRSSSSGGGKTTFQQDARRYGELVKVFGGQRTLFGHEVRSVQWARDGLRPDARDLRRRLIRLVGSQHCGYFG